jgi:uncharacterized protein
MIALVTGATSGIGRAYAVFFARNGYDLIVTGRRLEKLNELAAEMQQNYGTITEVIKAEFSLEKDVDKVMKAAERRQNIRVLVNNAGYGSGVEFCRSKIEDHLGMLHVHVEASVRLAYAVLPQMIRRNDGVIINVSSIGAYLPGPGSAMYTGTKLFLAGFSEALQMEVHRYGIKVQCICPGMTHSDFHDRRRIGHGIKTGKWMMMEPEKLVEKSIRSLHGNNVVVVPGIINKTLVGAAAFIPKTVYYSLIEHSRNIKVGPGFFTRMKQFIEKKGSFFFHSQANQV